jgi:hypothetical protein
MEGWAVLARAEGVGRTGDRLRAGEGAGAPGQARLQRLSGQKLYPVIEFENGSTYREESKDKAASIRAGRLDEKRGRPS